MDAQALAAFEEACKAVNGSTRLAELLTKRGRSVSKSALSQWKRTRIPADACPDIEEITGVRCERLRPDVNWSVLRNQSEA